jgi:hypothetical protein
MMSAGGGRALAGQAPAERRWMLLKEWTGGTGLKKTEKFVTTAESWRVSWKALEGDPDPIGSLTITVRDNAGHLVTSASNLGQKVSSGAVAVRSKPGEYYLEIEGADRKWYAAVEQ